MQPTLALDFSDGDVDDRLRFRRDSPAWRFGPHGTIEKVPAQTPRIDYDPATGECRGLLMESGSTNYEPTSASAAGTAYRSTEVSANQGEFVAPDGTESGTVVTILHDTNTLNSGAGVELEAGLSRFPPIPEGPIVCSVWLKKLSGTNYNPPLTLRDSDGNSSAKRVEISSTWERFFISMPATSGSNLRFQLKDFNAASLDEWPSDFVMAAWGIQVEQGYYPTSYIPTDGAPKTRAADTASIDDLGWFDPKKGTIVADFEMVNLESPKHRPQLMRVTGTHNQQYLIQGKDFSNDGIQFLNNYDGTYQTRGSINIGRPLADAPVRYAVGWETGEECFGYVEGDRYSYQTPQSLPDESETGRLRLGGTGGGGIGLYRQWLGELRYYPAYLSEGELRQHSRRPEYAHFDPVVPVTRDMTADAVWDTKGPRYQTLDNKKEVSLRMEVHIQENDYGVLWEAGGDGRGGSCLVVNNGTLYFHTGDGRSSGSGDTHIEVTAPIAPGGRVIEFSRSSASGKAALYIDGRLVANGQAPNLGVISGGDDGAVLTINQDICRNTSGTNADFTGGQDALVDGAYIFLDQLTEDVQ